jgi:Acyclic terpene utilisation family protein AtuA/Membrane dipeptidase (Peptidase family M19)
VAQGGGVIGACIYGPMCWDQNPTKKPGIDDYVRHLEHIVNLVGSDYVAFGTDLATGANYRQLAFERSTGAIGKASTASIGFSVRTSRRGYLADCNKHLDLPKVTAALAATLFLAPALHEFAWSYDDWPRLAAGLVAGHLLECSSQVNGGCFADPGKKEVEDLATLGYLFADISADGGVIIGKLDSNGGRLDLATCTEQLLYEIHDPADYVTPTASSTSPTCAWSRSRATASP